MHWLVLQTIKTDYNTNQMIFPKLLFIFAVDPKAYLFKSPEPICKRELFTGHTSLYALIYTRWAIHAQINKFYKIICFENNPLIRRYLPPLNFIV